MAGADDDAALRSELDVPACPAIVARIAEEMRAAEPDLRKLSALIATDVGLSAEVFRTVNSPFFGMNGKVTSVQQAFAVLGLRAGGNLVAGLMLRRAFPAAAKPVMQRFWDRSMGLAEMAAEIAIQTGRLDPGEAHTYALFRDCGAAVMIAKFDDYAPLFDAQFNQPGRYVMQDEDTRYRYSHARVGHSLARGWLLPEPFVQAILLHHEIEDVAMGRRQVSPAGAGMLAVGLLAEQVLCLRATRRLCPDWKAGEAFTLETLGIGVEDVLGLADPR